VKERLGNNLTGDIYGRLILSHKGGEGLPAGGAGRRHPSATRPKEKAQLLEVAPMLG
jgi:hypothetical protein